MIEFDHPEKFLRAVRALGDSLYLAKQLRAVARSIQDVDADKKLLLEEAAANLENSYRTLRYAAFRADETKTPELLPGFASACDQ